MDCRGYVIKLAMASKSPLHIRSAAISAFVTPPRASMTLSIMHSANKNTGPFLLVVHRRAVANFIVSRTAGSSALDLRRSQDYG
jgi:hypothetical protein